MTAVVLAFDRLPLSLPGCYGATWIDTPAFDRLASRSVTFDGCFASSASLAGPRAAAWTSRLAAVFEPLAERGIAVDVWSVEDAAGPSVLAEATGRLASVMAHERSRAIWIDVPGTGDEPLPDRLLVESFLEDFRSPREMRDAVAAWLCVPPREVAADETGDIAWLGDWLPRLAAQGLLDPSRPPADRAESALRRAVAAARVSELDAHLGRFLDEFDRLVGERDDALLIVVGLRGELLMWHPVVLAGMPPLVDEVLHVPLWIRAGRGDEGTRRGGLVSLDDVPAALAAWFGVESPPGSAGLTPIDSERRVLDGRHESLRVESPDGVSLRTAELHAVHRPRVESPVPRDERTWLFLKPDDLWDLQDLAEQMPEVTERMQSEIESGASVIG